MQFSPSGLLMLTHQQFWEMLTVSDLGEFRTFKLEIINLSPAVVLGGSEEVQFGTIQS